MQKKCCNKPAIMPGAGHQFRLLQVCTFLSLLPFNKNKITLFFYYTSFLSTSVHKKDFLKCPLLEAVISNKLNKIKSHPTPIQFTTHAFFLIPLFTVVKHFLNLWPVNKTVRNSSIT